MGNRLNTIGLTLFVTAGTAALVSQGPEVLGCHDADGANATTWSRGEISVPHCDSENMTATGNTIHDVGKVIAIVAAGGSAIAGIAGEVERRRRQTDQVPANTN